MIRDGAGANVGIEERFELNALCDSFEEAWLEDSASSITVASFVARAESKLRPYLVRELVAMECELKTSIGETPTRQKYRDQLPGYHAEVDAGFELWRASCATVVTAAESPLPDRIGDFRIVRVVGRGGMGVVYEAVQESLERRVAIKTLAAQPMYLPDVIQRFEREARAVARLHHSNIVDVYGSGVQNGIPYFAMHLVDGTSLRDAIREAKSAERLPQAKLNHSTSEGGLSPCLGDQNQIVGICLQIANALQYAHEQGILHRDIKPSNLLLDERGVVWVSDFGLAKLVEGQDDATATGDVVGTLRYLPPEALQGVWDERGDVYSLGLTLYELLTLQPAFGESQRFQLLDRIGRGDPPTRPSELNRSISVDLETIVMKALAREPDARYQSAAAFGEDLQRFLDGRPVLARRAGLAERLWKWTKRKPALAAFIGLISIVVFIGLPTVVFLWLRSESALTQAQASQQDLISAKKTADATKEIALDESYASSLQLAQQYLDEGLADETRAILQRWNPRSQSSSFESIQHDRRGWEWRYLNRQLDSSRLTLTGHTGKGFVHYVAIRPDDQQIATVGGANFAGNLDVAPGEVILWDAKTGHQQHVLRGHPSGVYGCAYSPNGKQIATIGLRRSESHGMNGRINVWDVDTGESVGSVDLPGTHLPHFFRKYHRPYLPGLRYSDDGKWLVSWPTPVEVRNASTLELIWSEATAHSAVFLPDNRLMLFGDESNISIRDLLTGMNPHKIWRPAVLFDFAYTDDRSLICATYRNGFKTWNPLSPKDRVTYPIDGTNLYWGSINRQGTMFVFGDRGGELHFHPLDKTRAATRLMGHDTTITHGAFSHDGKWIVTSSLDGTAKIWDTDRSHGVTAVKTKASHALIGDIAFTNNGTQVNYASRRIGGTKRRGTGWRRIEDPALADPCDLQATYFAHWPRTDFAYSPTGRFLAAPAAEAERPQDIRGFARSGKVNIWLSDNYELLLSIDVGFSEISSVVWSRDSALLAVAGTGESGAKESGSIVKVFSLPTDLRSFGGGDSTLRNDADLVPGRQDSPTLICRFSVGQFHVNAMSWRGDQLALATREAVTAWKLLPGEVSAEHKKLSAEPMYHFSEPGFVRFLDFSPDGQRLAAAVWDEKMVRVYDMSNGHIEYEADGPRSIGCVRFSPDGRRIALSGYDSLVFLCDSDSGRQLLRLKGSMAPAGTNSITPRVIFSADGSRIATNDWQGRITVWNALPIE